MSGRVTVVGLGTGGFDHLTGTVQGILLDPSRRIIMRTADHPAAQAIAQQRAIETADRFYEEADSFEGVYEDLAELVVSAAARGDDVVLAVPGSPLIAERTTRLVRRKAAEAGVPCEIMPAGSFLDAVIEQLEIDPLDEGLQILDGRKLPDPLVLGVPTVIAQVDVPVVMADVASLLGRILPEGTPVTVLRGLGSAVADQRVMAVEDLVPELAGPTTTLFINQLTVGWTGLVQTMRRLREECPWDAEQTHASLVPHLVEETYELVEAIASLETGHDPGVVEGAYGNLEEELGDVLLQVLFQTVMAREKGAFDIGDVVEALRSKLVRRHPHVFGTAEAGSASQVYARWEQIKAGEKPEDDSLMAGLPAALPALQRADRIQRRAAQVGFDWDSLAPVAAKVVEEVDELTKSLDAPAAAEAELGDLLFAVVNLSRHLEIDPEIALRTAVNRFEHRFRQMEEAADLSRLDLEQLDRLWEQVKAKDRDA